MNWMRLELREIRFLKRKVENWNNLNDRIYNDIVR